MSDTKLVKAAGEHWVCSVLARLGWSVALTRDGVERTDILGSRPETGWMIEVQVKAASFRAEPNWPINKKAQALARSPHEWFVFVALGETPSSAPRSFVVPRDHVAAATWIAHRNWLTEPGVQAGKRNATLDQARIRAWVFEGYEDRWDLLERRTSHAPVLLPTTFRDLAQEERVGLPPGHPWQKRLPRW